MPHQTNENQPVLFKSFFWLREQCMN